MTALAVIAAVLVVIGTPAAVLVSWWDNREPKDCGCDLCGPGQEERR